MSTASAAVLGKPQIDPDITRPVEHITLDLHEPVPDREGEPVMIGGQYDGLDPFGPQLTGEREPARVQLAPEPTPPKTGQHARDDGTDGRPAVPTGRPDGGTPHKGVPEIGDVQPIPGTARAYVVEGQGGGRNDQIMDALPVTKKNVTGTGASAGIHRDDTKIRHDARKSHTLTKVNGIRTR